MDRAQAILKNVFGYDIFRPLQQQIIENILNKKDSLVIMPTGGGKSICYQVPALIFEGLTVVISPLISLMKDQAAQLMQLGINAAMLNSSLSREEYNKNYNDVTDGKVKLLYVAPESVFKEEVLQLLKNIKIDCITVDEAHCISEWGHDFRKDYRQIRKLRKQFPSAVCVGLTATATPLVQDDIIKNLNLTGKEKFIASFNRENLFLQVTPKTSAFDQTVNFLNEHKNQSGIIYCFSRRQVDDLSADLKQLGFSTLPYHAGLSDEERSRNQDLFINDEIEIIVATIAFGMGINKSNVRFVIHHDLPKNIESYYQEIGRAGRDGLKADCLLLYSYSDVSKINYFIAQKENDNERLAAKAHLDAMVRLAEHDGCRRIPLINYFGEKYKIDNCGMCDNCIAEEKASVDATIIAQKFLSAVKRTGEIFGAGYVIEVLLGANSDRIFSNGHQNLSVYGIGKELNKKQWNNLSRQLVNKNYLLRDIEFGSLKLTANAYNVLLKNEKVFMPISNERSFKKIKLEEKYDEQLFEKLRKKRKELAEQNNVPPYVIFTDKSLTEMAAFFPKDKNSFLNINGVGSRKYESYGEIFLKLINDYCGKNKISQADVPKRISRSGNKRRFEIVGESFNRGASISSLAADYKVAEQTIIAHLLRYSNLGNKIRRDGIEERITISKEKQKEVMTALLASEDGRLKVVFEKFNGEISYEELRLIRILMGRGQPNNYCPRFKRLYENKLLIHNYRQN